MVRLTRWNTVLILIVTLQYYYLHTSGLRLQTISLYTDNGTTTENYTSNQPDLEKVSRIVRGGQLGSICAQSGVWAFFTSRDYSDGGSYGYHTATPEWTCEERRVSAYMSPYKSIRHLGNIDLDQPGLSLFSDALFAQNELYFNGVELSLSAPFLMNSFGFTGSDNWTLFTEPNFTGDGLCLCSDVTSYRSSSSGVTFEERLSFRIVSVRKGCYGSQVWLVDGQFVRPRTILTETRQESVEALRLQPNSNAAAFYFSGLEVNLPEPQSFTNFTTQLDSTWLIYSQQDFRGESLCIAGSSSGRLDNFPTTWSVRRGCDKELDSTTEVSVNEFTTESNINSIETTTVRYRGRLTSTFSVMDLSETETETPSSSSSSAGSGGNRSRTSGARNLNLDTIQPNEAVRNFYNTSTPNSDGSSSKNSISRTDQERISNADTNSIFFTAFIITLILLFLCILLGIGLFIYFRSTRKGHVEVQPQLQHNIPQSQS